MPDDAPDMVLVRRDDLRAMLDTPFPALPHDHRVRLLAAVNGEAATVEEPETEYRIVGRDGDWDGDYWREGNGLPVLGLRDRAELEDEIGPDRAPHRVEQRTVTTLVGPWTTQETP